MDLTNVFNTGGMVTGIGLLVVFICLIALIAIMVILPKLINFRAKRPESHKAINKKTHRDKAVKTAPVNAVQPKEEKENGFELVAVLAAAAAAAMDTQPGNIVIRSYRRISPSAWKKSGRDYKIFHKI